MRGTAPRLEVPPAPWHRLLRDLAPAHEHGFVPLRVEGTLPPELRGTFWRSGPGLYGAFGQRYRHWFDGDGMVAAVRFEGGRALGAVRLVQTRGLLAERRARRALYGGYGTPAPGGLARFLRPWRLFKNAANTAPLRWRGRLFSLFEGGRPTELDEDTLATRGETDLGGVVRATFSAHPHHVPARATTYNFGVRLGAGLRLDLYALADDGPARRLGGLGLRGLTMMHDFIATDRHLLFLAPPLRPSASGLVRGGALSDALEWDPSAGTEVIVVPLDEPANVVRFRTEAFWQWHFANAFERDGAIVTDLVRYPDFESNRWAARLPHGATEAAPRGTLFRAVVDLRARRLRAEERWPVACEFPRVAPSVEGRPHRWVHVVARSPEAPAGLPDLLASVDVERGSSVAVSPGPGRYPCEPVFAPRPHTVGERDGWLLAAVCDTRADETFVAVYDARALDAGPVARVHFDHPIPPTFHGIWAPAPA